jgi:hypothetical protein
MKNKFRAALAVFALLLVFHYSCTKKQDPVNTPENTSGGFISGDWTVSSYQQHSEDKTNMFSDYVFTFTGTGANSGSLKAVQGNTTVDGSWSHKAAVTYYGSTTAESFTLNLGTSPELAKISKLWNVSSSSASTLSLVSPETTEQEHLMFTKQ